MANMHEKADSIYKKFKSMPDGSYIATLVNIRAVVKLCIEGNPTLVLELGGGIGALSYTVLAHSSAFVDIYEDDSYCQKRLRENLKDFEGRYSIIPSYRILPPKRSYDLMLIDGGQKESYHPEWYFVRFLEDLKTIYIEGKRRSQYAWISKGLLPRFAFTAKKIPGEVIEGIFHKGGTLLRCTRTNSAVKSFISYLFARLAEDSLFDRLWKSIKRPFKIRRHKAQIQWKGRQPPSPHKL